MVARLKRFSHYCCHYNLCYYLLLSCAVALPSAGSRAEVVADLRYGVALYHFFQQSYFDAISEIMVAEQQQALPNHQRNAELLKGGMSLSYGMGSQAQMIFQQLLNEPDDGHWSDQQRAASDRQKRRAWFYLSKLYYQRGDSQQALAALTQMEPLLTSDDRLNDAIAEQALAMKSRLSLQRGDIAMAQQLDASLADQSVFKPYGYFNQGAYFAAAQQWQAAIERYAALVAHIDAMPNLDEELKLLRDKALTAAGYSLMHSDLPALAIEQFQRVRRDSPLVNQALLGFGWAELKRDNYHGALAPWQHLKNQSLLLPAVQEVYLAIPFAYEQLGETSAALQAYLHGAERYQQEINTLQQAIDHYQQQPLNTLFLWPESVSDDWLMIDEVMPATESAPYLATLLSRHQFQTLLKDYRALLTLRSQLASADSRNKVLTFVDREQQQLWQSVLEGERYSQSKQQYQLLLERKKQLDLHLQQAMDDDSGLQLLDANGKDLLARILHQQQAIGPLIAASHADEKQAALLDRYYGLLIWQAAENTIDKRWQLIKQRASLDKELANIEARFSVLDQLIASRKDSGFAPRISELGQRIEQQQRLVEQKLQQQDQRVRQQAIAVLQQQQQLLGHYLAQSKLSVARLYDAASMDQL